MNTDPTLPQGGPERRKSLNKSLQRAQPPTAVPGYEPERFLGVGAYGEVWVALERNTGRRVAIKFYMHRGGLDWSLLSREVEKLAFLFADRYVVQLIGVGWDSDPPYYIMEYLEQGSLAERLATGSMPVGEAVELFRDVAMGLVHAHGKGVLHCDLKPANILLDQDHKPRLADFGQSRLSHEQAPALGTLFYMAPEQADMEAVPDARWDVYALGALLYCMLTGRPPHRTAESVQRLEEAPSLQRRLSQYRRLIRRSPTPTDQRQVAGVDRALAEIVERCLAWDPKRRYPNVQAVLAALDARDANRARRPMKILGGVGPALVILVVSLFFWQAFGKVMQDAGNALTRKSLDNDAFAAEFVARTAGKELERRFEAVEQVAFSQEVREAIRRFIETGGIEQQLEDLSDPEPLRKDAQPGELKRLEQARQEFRDLESVDTLQTAFKGLIPSKMDPELEDNGKEEVSSWFLCDKRGVSIARVPHSQTIGKNYAWRSYFHGGARDLADESCRPTPQQRLGETKLSAVFRSQANKQWIVAVTCPIYDQEPFDETNPFQGEFLGVVALTVRVGRFVELEGGDRSFGDHQFAVLVDEREGDHKGMILQHPRLTTLQERLPIEKLDKHRLPPDKLPTSLKKGLAYSDPLAKLAAEAEIGYPNKSWLAQAKPVVVRGEPTGWWVIVQEAYDASDGTIGSTLAGLRSGLLMYGLAALVMVLLVVLGLWGFSIRLLKETSPTRMPAFPGDVTDRPSTSVTPDAPTETHRGQVD